MEVSSQVLSKCKQLANEIAEGKQSTDDVLAQVLEQNELSKGSHKQLVELIQEGIEKQKANRNINLELQNSLQRNQQQREELTVLTSECREIRDESQETQKKNDASIKESLERLSVSLAESKQNQLQAEHILKDVFENNHESAQLIERMNEIQETADTFQRENAQLNKELKSTLDSK